ncbi:MAG: hypothetical protein PW788_12780 [Micavibrio sp.]|nr:hypothetical protein [Micavibrio sp.]
MKYAVAITLFLLAAPAFADAPQARTVVASSSSDQRAAAELISARIRSALQGEPYSLDRSSCTTQDCR